MNKKVLILSASPRKHGNSDLLCDRFADGARESGNEVEKIFLDEKNIGFCRGCGACAVTKRCVIKDDMAEILDKMVKAHGDARLFLRHERQTENPDRPHRSTLYRDFRKAFLADYGGGGGQSGKYASRRRRLQRVFELSGISEGMRNHLRFGRMEDRRD